MPERTRGTDQEYLRTDQYRDGRNLAARHALHARFSVNPEPWLRWAFERLHLPEPAQVLELGCGRGDLWVRNAERIPAGWEVTLSDFSPGMLEEARRALAAVPHPFSYQVIDAQDLPLPDVSLDAVIANHMLYHVPDVPQALAEARRVLRPGGRLYAGTNGERHLRELWELLAEFTGVPAKGDAASAHFRLENGGELLSTHFAHVALCPYEDALEVTEVEPLVAYVLSGMHEPRLERRIVKRVDAFRAFVAERVARGPLHIGKSAGLFVAWN